MSDVELLASGYGLIEGPTVDAEGNLYFSDVPNGGVYRRSAGGEISVAVPKRRGVGGIALHDDGGLIVSGRNIQHVRDGVSTVLFDPGVPGFNDITTDAAGRIYCGSLRIDPFADGENVPGELYRIELDGSATQIYDGVRLTNGIGLSPDGTRLYHSDSIPGRVWVSDVDGDDVTNRRVFAEQRGDVPDGLAVDVDGGVWVALAEGSRVQRYLPDGTPDVEVRVPAAFITSVCFGGDDMRDLIVVTADNTDDADLGGCVFRTRVDVAGVRLTPARVPVGG